MEEWPQVSSGHELSAFDLIYEKGVVQQPPLLYLWWEQGNIMPSAHKIFTSLATICCRWFISTLFQDSLKMINTTNDTLVVLHTSIPQTFTKKERRARQKLRPSIVITM
jgi:hypothetical protein